MNLTNLFDLSFRGRRDSLALEFGGRSYTFGDIDTRSDRMAALFRERGLQAADRLCVYLPNSVEMIDVFLACVKLGVIFVPINILYREREITHILADSEPKAVIAAQEMPGSVPLWRAGELQMPETAQRQESALDGDTPAAIVYTSGTTGASKGAILVILERYGMTETLMNISNPYAGERRAGTVGLPLPGVSVRLVDGEIQLRGPNVFAGYWRCEEATRAAFDDRWFKTGDLAERSADGYYTLLGRKSDLIISGGFNIYPREIEEFLLEQEEVAEAAVVGVPDRLRGEVPVAYIVPRRPFDAAGLEARCRQKLASFKVPRCFVAVEKLPRTAMGKVQKHLLPKP